MLCDLFFTIKYAVRVAANLCTTNCFKIKIIVQSVWLLTFVQ